MESLRKAIYREFPEARVMDTVSKKRGAFEISINGKLVFSHLESCCYPESETVVALLHDVQDGKKPPVVERSNSRCTIL
ncbi:migration and invasion enhancer 1-like [Octopus sinensis]|uniref:Migration and invasion enhancer 1-like n=1 Tax=Octopus sinensis TaxID=2607531 RepID=A0A6P7T5V4_9MOLL|nr:migration and invasion enhancer 1-like [Octopus sinensis]XP_036365420.1 migration and invasion enhancer 1-like [Octopus sinensis]